MYGAEPPAPEAGVTELKDEKTTVDGHAIRRQYAMWFKADKTGPCVNWIVWIPVLCVIYAFPLPLQIQLAGIVGSIWTLLCLQIGRRSAAREKA